MAMAERHKKARGDPDLDPQIPSAERGGSGGESTSGSSNFPNLRQKFTIEAQIGDGGQGMVHRVRRISDGLLFAAKTVRTGENAPDLVRQEVQIMERLRAFPLIGAAGLEEVIVDSGFWHIVLELCACSLHDRIQRERGLSEPESALLIQNLARTVQRLHDVGVVHRDLKPPNILLTAASPPYEIRVADFGLSVNASEGSRLSGSVGTPKYLAPEVVRGKGYDRAVDIWGLGLILYEAVSGRVAYAGLESEFVLERLGWVDNPAGMLDWSGVGEEVKGLILGMLCLDPVKRLTTAEIQQHPWVLKHTQQQQQEESSSEQQEEFVPRTPSRVVKLRRLNGRWVSDRTIVEQQKKKIEKRKRAEEGSERKKLRLRCVNGLWQVEKQQCTAAVVA